MLTHSCQLSIIELKGEKERESNVQYIQEIVVQEFRECDALLDPGQMIRPCMVRL